MKILRLRGDIPAEFKKAATSLAHANSKELSAHTVEGSDPFLLFTQAEVISRLKHDLQLVENPIVHQGVKYIAEVIVAVDDSVAPEKLVGFITYKPRSPALTSASIAYAVVDAAYRGRGLLKAMLNELLSHYPNLGLDCPVALVPLYEKLGFRVIGAQGGHVAMNLGEINGIHITFTEQEMMHCPQMKEAQLRMKATLRQEWAAALDRFHRQNAQAELRAQEFVSSKLSETGKTAN